MPVEILLFELYRRKSVRIAATVFRVVEELDVIEHVSSRLLPVEIDFPPDTFCLSNWKKLSATALP